MLHPFQAIPADKYVQILVSLFVPTSILTVVLSAIPLKPSVVQFEFNAREVIKSWREVDKQWAAFSLGLDFLYLVVYSTTISLACIWAANVLESHGALLASIGVWLAWGQWLAALLDAVENIALVRVLFNEGTDVSPQIAKWCATAKFTLIALGLLYGVVGLVVQVGSVLALRS
jgi:hypothetical protein